MSFSPILKDSKADALAIFFPFILSLFFASTLPSQFIFVAMIAVSVIDSGHVYITAWRTWLHGRIPKSQFYIFVVPVAVFAVVFLWQKLQVHGLWSLVVYFTVFHNIRQLYGINKWYQNCERSQNKLRDFILYSICILSFLAFHFRTDIKLSYYVGNELFMFPDQKVFAWLRIIICLLYCFWLIAELFNLKKHKQIKFGSFLFTGFGSLIYSAAFLLSSNELQVFAPLIVPHGVHYLALVSFACVRTDTLLSQKRVWAVVAILASMIGFGIAEFYFEGQLLDYERRSVFNLAVLSLYLVPLLSHFILDAMIWKKQYFENHMIYRN